MMNRFYIPYPHGGFNLMESQSGVENEAIEASYLDSPEIWFALHLVDYDGSGKLVASIIKHGRKASAEAGRDRMLSSGITEEAWEIVLLSTRDTIAANKILNHGAMSVEMLQALIPFDIPINTKGVIDI